MGFKIGSQIGLHKQVHVFGNVQLPCPTKISSPPPSEAPCCPSHFSCPSRPPTAFCRVAEGERQRKVNDALMALEKKEEFGTAKRALRDSMYTSRYAGPEKAKIMGQGIQEAAVLAGVSASPPSAPSPYRIS